MGYGIGIGMVEGGPSKAFENGVRSYSDKVDVVWAGYEGYYAKDGKGQPRGWSGAIQDAGSTFLFNKLMGKVGETVHGSGPTPKGARDSAPKIKGSKPKAEPTFDAYKDGNERLAEDMVALRRKFRAGDPKTNPEYSKALEQVNKTHEIVIKRQHLEAELHKITVESEARIPPGARNPDGTVKTDHPDYQAVKAEWEGRMKEAWAAHNVGYEQRMREHQAALDGAGLKFVEASSKDPQWDVRMAGGNPKSIKSDIDREAHTRECDE